MTLLISTTNYKSHSLTEPGKAPHYRTSLKVRNYLNYISLIGKSYTAAWAGTLAGRLEVNASGASDGQRARVGHGNTSAVGIMPTAY